MASRKEDKKERKQKKEKKPAAEGDGTTTLVVSIDDFTRTRDSSTPSTMPARSHSRATTPGPGRGRTATPGLLLQDTAAAAPAAPLDLVQAITLLTYRINSTAQDLFLGAQQPAIFSAELTCEQVIVGLAALQSAVSDLSRAYINHANTVLNRGPSSIDIGGLDSLLENCIFPSSVTGGGGGGVSAAEGAGRAASPGARSVAGTKRKRVHDPNAPKRALTAYFLYMKHERANIAAELGANARPKEVADEGTRRWGKMPPQEKQKWKDLYAQNLAVYNEEMSAYKASLPPGHKVDSTVPATPKPAKAAKTSKSSKPSTKEAARHEDDDHDAAAEQQLQQAVREATTEDTSSESAGSSESEAEATPTPSPPKPTPKSQKRRQSKAAAPAPAPAPAPVIETPTPATKKSSPEKKEKEKKSKSKDKDRRASAANVAVEVASPAPEPPRSEKKARKKRKSAVDE
ncbi:urease [Trichophyton violaceum]|uniref:Urease n=1 Tax=Trichophyton violaceum TaxID=34388 RepID=A0A178FLZ3_TRIVO|nr:urease [Trichophyton violaceum]